jgi:hypothetical protein
LSVARDTQARELRVNLVNDTEKQLADRSGGQETVEKHLGVVHVFVHQSVSETTGSDESLRIGQHLGSPTSAA